MFFINNITVLYIVDAEIITLRNTCTFLFFFSFFASPKCSGRSLKLSARTEVNNNQQNELCRFKRPFC